MATILGQITVNQVDILEVNTDPSAGAGTPAPLGSLATQDDGGGLWIKTGPNDVDWTKCTAGISGTGGIIIFGYNGTAGTGRYLEIIANVPSSSTPFVCSTTLTLKQVSLQVGTSGTGTVTIYKNGVSATTISVSSGTTSVVSGLSISFASGDKINAKVTSGTLKQPGVYLFF